MYCLDTSVVIAIFRDDRGIAKKISAIDPDKVFFTDITLCELFKGAYKSQRKEESLRLVYDFVNNFKLLGLTVEGCEMFGKDFNALARTGKPTQEFDLVIASIAKENDLILVTRNKKDFENVPDLKIEEW